MPAGWRKPWRHWAFLTFARRWWETTVNGCRRHYARQAAAVGCLLPQVGWVPPPMTSPPRPLPTALVSPWSLREGCAGHHHRPLQDQGAADPGQHPQAGPAAQGRHGCSQTPRAPLRACSGSRNRTLSILTFPGVPAELHAMWQQTAVPWLRQQPYGRGVMVSRILRFWGVGESRLAEAATVELAQANPTVAPYAGTGEVKLRDYGLRGDRPRGRGPWLPPPRHG